MDRFLVRNAARGTKRKRNEQEIENTSTLFDPPHKKPKVAATHKTPITSKRKSNTTGLTPIVVNIDIKTPQKSSTIKNKKHNNNKNKNNKHNKVNKQ